MINKLPGYQADGFISKGKKRYQLPQKKKLNQKLMQKIELVSGAVNRPVLQM
jgi:hypothetical protein